MEDYPEGGQQYPQMPSYPKGSWPQGPVPPPAQPPAMQKAVRLIQAGAALGFISDVVNGLVTHTSNFFSYNSSSSGTTVHSASPVISGIIGGIIVAGLWVWMAWKTGQGRGWARVLSTVFFGISCLQMLVLVGLAANVPVVSVILAFVEWAIGLVAVVMLWKRESSEFFAAAKQAKFSKLYGS